MDNLFIFLVAFVGGCLPLLVRWSDRLLHLALALSTGIFLGAVFLHMLPALGEFETHPEHWVGSGVELTASEPHATDHDATDHDATDDHHGVSLIWISVLIGVLAVYLLEGLVFRSHDHDDLHRHRAVSYASLIGLALHSLTTGLGLAAAGLDEGIRSAVFLAIMAHKGFETFSLATVFQLAHFSRRWILGTMTIYATITPLGVILGGSVFSHLPHSMVGIALALAAGTFLYVCLCELLPELFHHKEDSVVKIFLLTGGIVLMALIERGGHA